MRHVAKTVDRAMLPVPEVYLIPFEKERQKSTGMGRQITKFIPGVVAMQKYPGLPHESKLAFVRKMATAYQACWVLDVPNDRGIGELIAEEVGDGRSFSVGPDRHHGLGGPFLSVRDYLRAYIKASLAALEKQEGIQEYKDRYLDQLRGFIEDCTDKIPAVVEDVPIVSIHADMGLHNHIVLEESPTEFRAIIDWEFVANAPFLSVHRLIESLFRRAAPNGFGIEYEGAGELREAFWGAIPEWRARYHGESGQEFLKWFRFALFLKAEPPMDKASLESKFEYWGENVRVVEDMLGRSSL